MPKFYTFSLLFFLFYFTCSADVITLSVDGGNWNTSGSWSPSGTPTDNDTVIIPQNFTVNVNCNCGTYSNMLISVFGTLDFGNGRKIIMSANGTIDVYSSGRITGGNSGTRITIGGNNVWSGNQADIVGKETCTSGGCAENSTLPVEFLGLHVTQNDRDLRTEWTTATEVNNDYFTVYFSENATDWYPETILNGNGTTAEQSNYEVDFDMNFIDYPMRYILLSQTDFDGRVELLDQQALNIKSTTTRNVTPNPSNGRVNVSHQSFDRIQIYNASGELVYHRYFGSETKTTL